MEGVQLFSQLLHAQRRFSNMTAAWGGTALASTIDNIATPESIANDCERTVVVTKMNSVLS